MVERLLRSADFQRVLSAPPRSRSAHFAVHHVPACPSLPAGRLRRAAAQELSTGAAPLCAQPVDECPAPAPRTAPPGAPSQRWLGLVVPKRHARRAVTRNLLKRQMRTLIESLGDTLPPGLWVLRLKAPFDRQAFASPASDPLRACARAELLQLLQRAVAVR